VVREISRCRHLLSTSLHGLVVADSYGIPAAWARLSPDLIGATYKFHDHESVVTPGWSRQIELAVGDSVESVIERTQPADGERVRASIAGLRDTVMQLPVTRAFPPVAWWHR
jgi:pyruvyltransferase